MAEEFTEPRKEKPHLVGTEKKTVSEEKDELVVRIPLVVWFRPIVVEPQTIRIVVEVPDVRVAVSVGLCAISSVALSI